MASLHYKSSKLGVRGVPTTPKWHNWKHTSFSCNFECDSPEISSTHGTI